MTSAGLDDVLTLIVCWMFSQILLRKPYNTAVDWFSAGVMIYEMATGKYPFCAGILPGTIEKSLINDVPTYPKGLNPQARDLIVGVSRKTHCSNSAAKYRENDDIDH